eukprot:TRINITY_DN4803_c0_g3_i2.p4 TRINITY_DN4803_c0_g3~~TRINITY_DN4803_c0_g3_i2.p4  ORF type:complete len:152 (-),score=13.60 TRINITY_DN4803_c0_g3_i2:2-457(-)
MTTRQARKYLRQATREEPDYSDLDFPHTFVDTPTARLISEPPKSHSFPGSRGQNSIKEIQEEENEDSFGQNGSEVPTEDQKIHSTNSIGRPVVTRLRSNKQVMSHIPGTGVILRNISRRSTVSSRSSRIQNIWRVKCGQFIIVCYSISLNV